MIRARLAAAVPIVVLPILALSPFREATPDPTVAAPVRLQGVGNGITLLPDPYFKFTPAPKDPRAGVMGSIAGPTREFESISLEIGADRRPLTAPIRAGYEAYRIKHDVERGESQVADVKPEMVVVRIKNPFREAVYATGLKQIGRTTVFVRGSAEKKNETGLVKLIASVITTAKGTADEVDGWIPPEVKATWTHTPSGELLLVDDGTVDGALKTRALKGVSDAFALAKRVIGGGNVAPFPPVVRVVGSRDLFAHLAGRRDLGSSTACYVPFAAELLVCPKGAAIDDVDVAGEAARLATHYLTGVADAEPLATGLARMAAATATPGATPGALLLGGRDAAIARAKAKEAKTWFRLLMMGTLTGFLSEDADTRALDAELAVNYLAGGGALGRTSMSGWLTAIKKWGHVDAAAEGGVAPLDGAKADAEYWAYWTPRADPPKKPGKPGSK